MCHMLCRACFVRGFKETEKNNKSQFHCCCSCIAGRVEKERRVSSISSDSSEFGYA